MWVSQILMVISLLWATMFFPKWWYICFNAIVIVLMIYQSISEKKNRSAELQQQKRSEERIRHMVYYDDLTGLPNRRHFREQLSTELKQCVEKKESVAVFYMDIDRFKFINDSLGHDYGDILLLHVAERLTHVVDKDDFVARMEGDEFALFYKHVHSEELADLIARRILATLEAPFTLKDYHIHISASIGIAIAAGEKLKAEDLMRGADMALSRAKENGKNTYRLYTDVMNTSTLERLKLEHDLRKAMKNGEFELHYQPQVHSETGKIIGFEALLRWFHPEQGLISPGVFIPLAEEIGIIEQIGEWAILEACKQNKAWQDAGYEAVTVSVNISTQQFKYSNLTETVAQILQETQLDPQYLGLEITESVMLDYDYASTCLNDLKKLGVHISIDDFGTGYCSLGYLKKLPIDKLKIDRSFVDDVLEDPNDAAIVSTIIAMAKHLNLSVIAEGVETEGQKTYLYNQDCVEVQGYLYSPAVSAKEIEQQWKTTRNIQQTTNFS